MGATMLRKVWGQTICSGFVSLLMGHGCNNGDNGDSPTSTYETSQDLPVMTSDASSVGRFVHSRRQRCRAPAVGRSFPSGQASTGRMAADADTRTRAAAFTHNRLLGTQPRAAADATQIHMQACRLADASAGGKKEAAVPRTRVASYETLLGKFRLPQLNPNQRV